MRLSPIHHPARVVRRMTASITRLDSTGHTAQLERIAASGLLSQGSVNTIELDAIRAGMEDKWPKRREQVWAHVEKTLAASGGDAVFFMRLNETSYLVSLPDLGGAAAQSKCARILRELLNFFLGASNHEDILVRNVTFVDGEQIRTVPVSLRPDTLAPEPIVHHAPGPQPFRPRRSTAGPILSCAGPLAVSLDVEHVYRIREFALAARRIKTNVTDGLSHRPVSAERLLQLETSALAAIDMEAVAFAMHLLADAEFPHQGVFVPISIQTMSNSRARAAVLDLIAEDPESAGRRLIIELVNLSDGTPNGRVSEVSSYVRNRVRGVFGRLSMSVQAFKSLRGAALMGTVMDTVSIGNFNTALASNILAFGEVARSIAPALVAGPLPKEDFIDICAVAGVTHVTLQAPHVPAALTKEQRAAVAPSADDPHRVIYVSRSKLDPGDSLEEKLAALTRESALRNSQSYVTGLLTYYSGWFLQVLEGDRRAVSRVLQRVMADPRHEDILLIDARAVKERAFPRWSMAGLVLPPDHQALVESLDPGARHDPGRLTPEAAMQLLQAIARMKDEETRESAAA
ncbi:MAG: BLUF domain-containing protein [Hyphomonadaceae bacterium]|nr:BLUF domain-containing protein [Hyphomonadaceae bacterium]